MPNKGLQADEVPSLVTERLQTWGACIRTLRLEQKVRVSDLCARMGITHTTLRRLEKGDPGAGAGLYLSALMILGALEMAAPSLPGHLLHSPNTNKRVRIRHAHDIDDHF
ncbi:MAG TPA: helix-turn-helix transcriptional regulator [Noviherbaspirillum sp.]|jgi:transcriptional regulator with XRE-family HTH domain|uniref:helix-turn-helix domain-containing protein n=1 Tax=Noviherbaspirillum sp. TaxID=1926288 RepID=UPI002DDD5EFB|nr:helix-turn-helix transcriptional regulator [Noviherbaspirillum sp.]HEV2610770.1 helix-turn-helix transcriptional regulator [Noviherbaspirillum sp.]